LIISKPQTSKINANNLRQPFFQKYPLLYGVHSALFRVRHLMYVYGVDGRSSLFSCVSQHELDRIASDLLSDDDATRALSTYAVNFLYLYKAIVLQQKECLDPKHFIGLSNGYDLTNNKHLQLLIYLFTHCIIGESNFYVERLPAFKLDSFRQMLSILEAVIDKNFADINLDNKLEFLVCCRICGVDSPLFAKIYSECENSVSSEGCFLVDKHNANPQSKKATFESSEHRNVLFIMSNSEYSPHSTLI